MVIIFSNINIFIIVGGKMKDNLLLGNEFAKNFRKMITIEQFRNEKMTKLFQDVIGYGPIKYSADILAEMMETGKLNDEAAKMGAMNLAIMLFAPPI